MARDGGGSGLLFKGCLALVLLALLCAGCAGVLVVGVGKFMKRADVYQKAVGIAVEDSSVQRALGRPIEEAVMPMGSVSVSGTAGEAAMTVGLHGPSGSGDLLFEATRQDSVWTYSLLAFVVDGTGERIDLIHHVAEEARRAAESESESDLVRARDAFGRGDFSEAVAAYDDVIAVVPDSAEAHAQRGLARFELGDTDGAVADWQAAVALEPNHVDANEGLGRFAMASEDLASEDLDACIEHFTAALKGDAERATAWHHRAVCYEKKGESRQALAGAREACSLGHQPGCQMAVRLK